MSAIKKIKTSKRDILKEPEFLEAFKMYLKNGEKYSNPVIEATIEIFSTLNRDKLPSYSFDSLDDILDFDKNVLGYLFAGNLKKFTEPPVSPETREEFQKMYDIIKKHDAFV